MKKFLIALLVGLGVFIGSCNKNAQDQASPSISNLSLPILGSKSQWSLGPLLGKKTVLLAFFTTWCPYCNHSMPYLQDFYEKNKNNNFELIGIDLDESEAKLERFNQKFGLTFPLALGRSDAIGADFPVRFLPTFYLVRRDGRTVRKFEGFNPDILEEITKSIN